MGSLWFFGLFFLQISSYRVLYVKEGESLKEVIKEDLSSTREVSGEYLIRWGKSLGMYLSPKFSRGFLFFSPGISFSIPISSFSSFDSLFLQLYLEDFSSYPGIFRYRVYIEGIFIEEREEGYNKGASYPWRIPIPSFFWDREEILVEIRLSYHPSLWGVLYKVELVASY